LHYFLKGIININNNKPHYQKKQSFR